MIRSCARFATLALCATTLIASCSSAPSSDAAPPEATAVPKAEGEIETPSGLRIAEVEAGTGASPKPTDVVLVHYHGTFPDGKVFDSSVDRGQPARFPLNRVIPCWTEGLQLMKEGGKSRLVCPPSIAYGASGAPPRIPQNATLIFDVELLGIGK